MSNKQGWQQQRRNKSFCLASAVCLTLLSAGSAFSLCHALSAHRVRNGQPVKPSTSDVRLRMRSALEQTPSDAKHEVGEPQPSVRAPYKPTLKEYAMAHCTPFTKTYAHLLDDNVGDWQVTNANLIRAAGATQPPGLFIYNNSIFVDQVALLESSQSNSLALLLQHLRHLQDTVRLPDLALSVKSEAAAAAPQLSFCTRQGHAELAFPHFLDSQRPAPVVGRQGWPSEQVMLQSADPNPVAKAAAQLTSSLSKCSQLSAQPSSSSAPDIFKVEGSAGEWHAPLLKPFVHYIPFVANTTYDNLLDMLNWANQHRYAASVISQQAREFAQFYLSQRGRKCYAYQLLFRLNWLGYGSFTLPRSATDISNCISLSNCPHLSSSSV